MSEVKRIVIFRSAMEAVKHRLKLTWIAWFYICARRTLSGSILMVLLAFSLLAGAEVSIGYLSLRRYSSYDELPCQVGVLTHFGRPRKEMSFGVLVDAGGVEHKFYEEAFRYMELDQLELLKGQEIKVCFNLDARILLPQIYRRASLLTYPSGDHQATWTSSVKIDRALELRGGLIRFWFLWIATPALIWLVVRHGLQAWREMTGYSRLY